MAHPHPYNDVDHSRFRFSNYTVPSELCDGDCQIAAICRRMVRAVKHPAADNDEIRERYRLVATTRFVCPRGRCHPRLLRLKFRLARDIAELPPAPEAVPLPAVDGVEAGFLVPAVHMMALD